MILRKEGPAGVSRGSRAVVMVRESAVRCTSPRRVMWLKRDVAGRMATWRIGLPILTLTPTWRIGRMATWRIGLLRTNAGMTGLWLALLERPRLSEFKASVDGSRVMDYRR